MAKKHRSVPLTKRGFDFDTFMWAFVRLSALAMYLLAFIGLIGALIMGARTQMNLADIMRWMFMPNPNHVLNTNIPDIDPWATIFWKIMGSAFVLFAASHGLHGLLSVLEDYLTEPRLRRALRILFVPLTAAMMAIGIYVMWTS